jgi:hypothetical protein
MQVKEYLERVDDIVYELYIMKKIKEPKRIYFFSEILGLYEYTYKNWYKNGIRKTHIVLLQHMEEVVKKKIN